MSEQKRTEYEMSDTEKRLLETLLDPRNRHLSITQICSKANIGRTTYYRLFDNPEFEAIVKRESKRLVDRYLSQVMNAFVREAQRGSYNHGKTLLEMAGLHVDKKELTGKDGGPLEVETWVDIAKEVMDYEKPD